MTARTHDHWQTIWRDREVDAVSWYQPSADREDVTVLDVSEAALDAGRDRLGALADRVRWVAGDVTTQRFDRTFDVWHDRAVLHFLRDPAAARYVERLVDALPGVFRCRQ